MWSADIDQAGGSQDVTAQPHHRCTDASSRAGIFGLKYSPEAPCEFPPGVRTRLGKERAPAALRRDPGSEFGCISRALAQL